MTLAALLGMLGATQAAWAAPVLQATSAASANSIPATPSTFTTTAFVSSNSQSIDLLGSGSGRSFASGSGAYYVGASATGLASGAALASFANSYTNTSGLAQLYTLNFHIYGGGISTNLASSLITGESLSTSYSAKIKVNGNIVWNSTATITQTDTGITSAKTGIDLNAGDDGTDGNYSWGGGYYNVVLGSFADGATLNIEAIVEDDAFANVGTYSFDCGGGYGGYGGNGYGGNVVATCESFKGAANASYGDPIDLTGVANPDPASPNGGSLFQLNPTNAVPEPASLALAGLALAAAAGAGRRRKRGAGRG